MLSYLVTALCASSALAHFTLDYPVSNTALSHMTLMPEL
jgi:hypothetical protein